jgi:hypothetical protein
MAIEGKCLVSDQESILAAVEEAQRILTEYEHASPRRHQDDVLNMVQFILCSRGVRDAMKRLKFRACFRLVE